MSLFHFITLILLSGQVSGSAAQIGPGQGWDGWEPNEDKTLNYIIKLTPQLAEELGRNGESAKFTIPPHILKFMGSVTFQIGDTPVVRNPPENELKADLANLSAGPELTTLNGSASNQGKFADIDRKGSAASRIQTVNQNGVSAFGIPSGGTGNPAISNTATPYANPTTTNPALTGNTATSSPYSNPALTGRASESQYPINNLNNDRYTNSQSSIGFNDPPSVPTAGFSSLPNVNNSQPLSPFSAPSTYVPFNRGNEGINGSGSSNFSRGGESATSNYPYGANNASQYPSSSGAVRPSTYPGSNTFPYPSNSGTLVNTHNPYLDEVRPDARTASNRDGIQNNATSSSDIAAVALQNSKLLDEINQLKASARNARQNIYDETLTPQQIRELESSAKLLLWFQLFSIILFVACCFLGGSLFRLYNAYRNLRVSSRHAVNLGI